LIKIKDTIPKAKVVVERKIVDYDFTSYKSKSEMIHL
jgi:hypothetical protein